VVRQVGWLAIASFAMLSCAGRPTPRPAPQRPPAPPAVDPDSVERVSPEIARAHVLSGQALLVCAYDDVRCAQNAIEGAITLSALQGRLPELPMDQEIILYCA